MNPAEPTSDIVDKATYQARRGEILLHMSHFFAGYLNSIYRAFDGDLAMAIVLGEISHHNTSRIFRSDSARNPELAGIRDHQDHWNKMIGCNAYSISLSTAIPRETVRRKVAALKKRGWLEDMAGQGLRITPACADHFGPDFSWTILNGMLRTAKTIEGILSEPMD